MDWMNLTFKTDIIIDCQDFFFGLFNQNLIKLKHNLVTNLNFINMMTDPKANNYIFENIPFYDKTIDNLGKIYDIISDEWW